ncbi:hypothetical protein D3C75_1356870 [compost metagenome]
MLFMLNSVADLVAGNRNGGDRSFVIYRFGQPDYPMNRVIMVCQCSTYRFNRYIM